MPKFKDLIQSDMQVFFNLDEFAEIHNINGTEITAVIDSDILKIRSNNKTEQYDGVYKGEIVLYVKAANLSSRPVFGQLLRLDGEPYVIIECTESMGVLEIVLGANQA